MKQFLRVTILLVLAGCMDARPPSSVSGLQSVSYRAPLSGQGRARLDAATEAVLQDLAPPQSANGTAYPRVLPPLQPATPHGLVVSRAAAFPLRPQPPPHATAEMGPRPPLVPCPPIPQRVSELSPLPPIDVP